MTLLIFILVLGIIIFIHELGHFIMAKKNGIYVYEFSLGFGPKLFSFKRKNDETEYMIKLIPLGGYVMLAGETDEDDKKIKDDQKLFNKSFLQKMSVMVAGVFNNFLLGILLLFIIGFLYGTDFTNNSLYNLPENYPLYKAGARNGDLITKIDNISIRNYDDIQVALAIAGEGKKINVTVKKPDGKVETYKIKPKYDEEDKNYYYGISIERTGKKGVIDIISSLKEMKKENKTITFKEYITGNFNLLFYSVKYAFVKFVSIFKGLIIIIVSLFTGKLSVGTLSGPVGVYQAVGMASKSGAAVFSLMYLTAYLSINVGFMNILPFPAFDGGQAFLLIIEKITGKKISTKIKTIINSVGFALLMVLMVYVTIKDFVRIFKGQ